MPLSSFTGSYLNQEYEIVDESSDQVMLMDEQGYAQFDISTIELDHSPTPKELDRAIKNQLGDASKQEGFEQLLSDDRGSNERMVQFENLAENEDGTQSFYRNELRAFARGNALVATSFSTPPHDWEHYAPAYELILELFPESKTELLK